MKRNGLRISLFLAALAGSATGLAAQELPSYDVDLEQTSVSGVSSGAYMAGQLHIAFSDIVSGAGLVAGGPYYCAQGLVSNALNSCMATTLGTPDPARLLAAARDLAGQDKIDDLSNIADDKVYIFGGTQDETVLPQVVETAVEFYRLAGLPAGGIKHVPDIPAGHAMITEDFGGACAATASPYINDCDYGQAGDILQHIYGQLDQKAASPGGQLVTFDQGVFIDDPNRHSMSDTGYVYVPASCRDGEQCRVHIALHGCRQTTADIDTQFVDNAGYNEWADTNRIIVLYPQGFAGPGNPRGCWDWWGYDGPDYHVKTARQMTAVMAMVNRLASSDGDRYCQVYEASNYAHWMADRATWCGFWSACAKGSGDDLGLLFSFATVTLYEHPQGTFGTTDCNG